MLKSLIIVLANTILIYITFIKYNDVKNNKNEWEKAKDLNLSTYYGGHEIQYNITSVLSYNEMITEPLEKLKGTLFFKIFKLRLEPECSVFKQEMICKDTACQICECKEGEVPGIWKQPKNKHEELETHIEDPFNKWKEKYNINSKEWLLKDDIDPEDGSYINLLKNKEGYTGYKGAHIWEAIFRENCFADKFNTLCKEDRIFYRIFSGWVSNTNFQIGCNFHKKNSNETFINLTYVGPRLLYNREKMDYLFFLYSLMLKAAAKARPVLLKYNYISGNEKEDNYTYNLIKKIFNESNKIELLENSFNETNLEFEIFMRSKRISELIVRFRNISSIIDCVTCSKCRMHAKLEVFGMATMLKIMFTPNVNELLTTLKRNELVSFINLFAKLSKSVSNINLIDKQIKIAHKKYGLKSIKTIIFFAFVGVFINFYINFIFSKYETKKDNDETNINKNEIKNNKVKKPKKE